MFLNIDCNVNFMFYELPLGGCKCYALSNLNMSLFLSIIHNFPSFFSAHLILNVLHFLLNLREVWVLIMLFSFQGSLNTLFWLTIIKIGLFYGLGEKLLLIQPLFMTGQELLNSINHHLRPFTAMAQPLVAFVADSRVNP